MAASVFYPPPHLLLPHFPSSAFLPRPITTTPLPSRRRRIYRCSSSPPQQPPNRSPLPPKRRRSRPKLDSDVDPVGFLAKAGISDRVFAQFLRDRHKAYKDRKFDLFSRFYDMTEASSGYEILGMHRHRQHRVDFMEWAPGSSDSSPMSSDGWPRTSGGSASLSRHDLRDPEVVRSLMATLVTPAFSRSLGSELLRDPRRLQDTGVVETFSGLLKTILAQMQGVPSGATGAGSSASAESQELLRRAEVVESEAAGLRAELARERQRREDVELALTEAERRLAAAGIQAESEASSSGESEQPSAGGSED